MHGQKLKASLYATKPFLFHPENGRQAYGVLISVLATMAEKLGFTFQGSWAENWWLFSANGTIGGSLGDVQYIRP